MKSNKEEILKLYFEEKLKQVEIAKKLGISNNAVSKVLKKDNRFTDEKNRRKNINKQKHNKQIQTIVENKRRIKKDNEDYYILKKIHEQDTCELSGRRKRIGDIAFRNWNSSIYKYSEKTKSYILKKGITVGADVPKRIIWK